MCSRSAQAPGFRNSSQLTEKLPGGRFPSTAFERKPPMMFLSTGHFRVRVLHTRTWSCTAVMPPSTPGNDCPHKALSRKGWRSEPPVALSGCVSSASFNLEKFLRLSSTSVTLAFQKTIRGMSLGLGVFGVCPRLCELCVFGRSTVKWGGCGSQPIPGGALCCQISHNWSNLVRSLGGGGVYCRVALSPLWLESILWGSALKLCK